MVDDDENVTHMLRRALSYEGYAVATAKDGPEALHKALEFAPELVVLDVLMPGIDGVEVCRRLRAGDSKLSRPLATYAACDRGTAPVRGSMVTSASVPAAMPTARSASGR